MQIVKGLGSIYDGFSEVLESVNPNITTMKDGKNQEIAASLLASGVSIKEIQDFVDVSRVQLDEFLAFEVEIQKRLLAAQEPPVKTTKRKAA